VPATPTLPSAGAGNILNETPAVTPVTLTGEPPFIEGEDGKQGWDMIRNDIQDSFTEALESAGVDVSEVVDENGNIDLEKLASNPEVLGALKELETPLNVTVNMNGAVELPGDIVSLIAGKNIDLTLEMVDGIAWTINGNSVTGTDFSDINLGVSKNTTTIPVDVINQVSGENYTM